jgi:hypothetical protein
MNAYGRKLLIAKTGHYSFMQYLRINPQHKNLQRRTCELLDLSLEQGFN